MEVGIIGLPNVGKTTLFNALTGAAAAAENFPFTTIEPNIGVVPILDPRLTRIAEEYASQKITPAGIRFVDIAGLVKGAHQGEGLGNKFLSHIRSVDAVAHVVRCFRDDNVVNVAAEVSPLEAIDMIETELILADLQQCEKTLDKYKGAAHSGDRKAKEKTVLLEHLAKRFNEGKPARSQNFSAEEIGEYQFLTAKPVLYIANTDESNFDEKFMASLRERAKKESCGLVVLCAKLEAEIMQLPLEERGAYYESAGIISSGLNTLAKAGQELLKLVCFFTANEKETRAWLIPKGTKAVKAAGKIHTDMERGFIRAEVYKYDDLMRLGSHKALQEHALISLEGKDYEIQEGDVVYFRFNV